MRHNSKAFTLIELLVVIAIIAILAAILFPVFAQAKRAAKTTVALSGFKQTSLGYLMYTNDYDDMAPMERFWTNNQVWSQWYTWRYAVYPYIKNAGIWLDPNAPSATNELGDDSANPSDGWNDGAVIGDVCATMADQAALDHGSNWQADVNIPCKSNIVDNDAIESWYATGTTTTSMTIAENPANLLLLEDSRGYWEGLGPWWPTFTPAAHNSNGDLDLWTDNGGAMAFWDNAKGGIYAFYDGHAKLLRASQTFQTGNNFMWANPGTASDATILGYQQMIRDNFVSNGQEVY